MEKAFRSVAFWATTIASTAFLLVVMIATIWVYIYTRLHPSAHGEEHATSLAMTYGVLLVVAGFFFSCVSLGWNRDRREVSKLHREIDDLRVKLRGLELRGGAFTTQRDN